MNDIKNENIETVLLVGSNAPLFSLLNQNETMVNLADLMGRWVILYFYPKDNTPTCSIEGASFSQHLDDFTKLGAVVFGISSDSYESHLRFIDRKCLKVDLLSDPDKIVCKAYNSISNSSIFGIKLLSRVMRNTFLIDPEGRVAYIWKNIKVQGHVLEILNKIKELS